MVFGTLKSVQILNKQKKPAMSFALRNFFSNDQNPKQCHRIDLHLFTEIAQMLVSDDNQNKK